MSDQQKPWFDGSKSNYSHMTKIFSWANFSWLWYSAESDQIPPLMHQCFVSIMSNMKRYPWEQRFMTTFCLLTCHKSIAVINEVLDDQESFLFVTIQSIFFQICAGASERRTMCMDRYFSYIYLLFISDCKVWITDCAWASEVTLSHLELYKRDSWTGESLGCFQRGCCIMIEMGHVASLQKIYFGLWWPTLMMGISTVSEKSLHRQWLRKT